MFEEDFTPEQAALIAALGEVAEALAEWAREQFREGFTVGQVKSRIHDAAVKADRA